MVPHLREHRQLKKSCYILGDTATPVKNDPHRCQETMNFQPCGHSRQVQFSWNRILDKKYSKIGKWSFQAGSSFQKGFRDVPTQKLYVPYGHTLESFMCLPDKSCSQNLPYSNLSMNMDNSSLTKTIIFWVINTVYILLVTH